MRCLKSLIIGDCGKMALTILSFLNSLEIEELLDIKYFSCSGNGSILCLLMICGYRINDIITICIENPVLFNALSNIYSDEDSDLKEILENLVKEKLYKIPTFKEIYTITGKKIYCSIFKDSENIVTTYKDNYLCTDIIMASLNIDIIRSASENYLSNYVSSAFVNPIPLLPLINKRDKIIIYIREERIETTHLERFINYLSRYEPPDETFIIENKLYERTEIGFANMILDGIDFCDQFCDQFCDNE